MQQGQDKVEEQEHNTSPDSSTATTATTAAVSFEESKLSSIGTQDSAVPARAAVDSTPAAAVTETTTAVEDTHTQGSTSTPAAAAAISSVTGTAASVGNSLQCSTAEVYTAREPMSAATDGAAAAIEGIGFEAVMVSTGRCKHYLLC
jgi:hypothetical protein